MSNTDPKTCPKCGLLCVPTAAVCDCGYNFATKKKQRFDPAEVAGAKNWDAPLASVEKPLSVKLVRGVLFLKAMLMVLFFVGCIILAAVDPEGPHGAYYHFRLGWLRAMQVEPEQLSYATADLLGRATFPVIGAIWGVYAINTRSRIQFSIALLLTVLSSTLPLGPINSPLVAVILVVAAFQRSFKRFMRFTTGQS